jgi:hypothetical protein
MAWSAARWLPGSAMASAASSPSLVGPMPKARKRSHAQQAPFHPLARPRRARSTMNATGGGMFSAVRSISGWAEAQTRKTSSANPCPTASTPEKSRMTCRKLCRYLTRPPIAQDRLELLADDRLQYTLKKTWRDGTRAIVLDPLGFIARLCAMIPPPRVNMIRFHGLFAPNAKRRAQVITQPENKPLTDASPAALADTQQLPLFGAENPCSKRNPWAFLLRHVFLVDVTLCPECGGRMKWLEVATEPKDIRQALAQLGLAPPGPLKPPPSRGLFGQLSLPFRTGPPPRFGLLHFYYRGAAREALRRTLGQCGLLQANEVPPKLPWRMRHSRA